MDIRQLRAFVAAAETGAISRAAERLRVAQPSVSQQVQRLEADLGTRVFDRLGRGVALTDAGAALLPRARRILAEVDEARASVVGEAAEGLRLAVGAIPTMAPYLLPRALRRLREERPGCEVAVREDFTENLLEALVEHSIDVAIVSTPIEHDLIEVDVVGSEELLVVAPAAHELSAGGEITLGELRDQPRVTLHEMHCLGRQISGFCAARRVSGNVVCRTAQLATVLEMVRLGMGVSLAPAMAAAGDAGGERVYLRVRKDPPRRSVALAWRRGRTRGRLALRLSELVAGALSELPFATARRGDRGG